jgi:predicted O-methyltransferase YrrM
MNLLPDNIENYIRQITPSAHPVLDAMEKLAEERDFPIVGPLVGRILFQLGRLTGAKRVMELGSGYGYSAFWWAIATPPDAKIYCTEGSAENAKLAQEFLTRAGVWQKIEYYVGDALEGFGRIPGTFDIIFMDIDKHGYPDAFRQAYPRLRKGGLFVTDNVLWSGRVVEQNPDKTTRGVIEYNKLIYNTPGAFSTILPVRDGVAVTLKE